MHPKAEKFRSVISKYIPESSVEYVLHLWLQTPFHFRVTQARQSKHGDYEYNPKKHSHTITLNGSLNPYLFLITFIHEVAHLRNYEQHGQRVAPHGQCWKSNFQQLMDPVLNEYHFPPELLARLRQHMENPKATSDSDFELTRILRHYDKKINGRSSILESIRPGEKFILGGKVYRKIVSKRTRALCKEMGSGKEYYISEISYIEKIQ